MTHLDNLDRLHEALEPLSMPERRAAEAYLLGAVSEAIPPAQWELALGWALTYTALLKEAGRL